MVEICSKNKKLIFVFVLFLFFGAAWANVYAQSEATAAAGEEPSAAPTAQKNTRSPRKKAPSNGSNPRIEEETPEEAAGVRSGTKLLTSGKFLHLSCTRSLRDLENNRLECFGNVYIRRPSELLTADYAVMDLSTEQLHAEGNVVYFTPDTVIYGSKMDFNFITETGIIEDGRVESDKYQLLGEKIERLSINHFKAYDGEYTTCRDCPASWKIAGKTIDLTVNGYAYLSHVFIKINEAPAMYIPYAVIPVKTERQSGFLFPRFQVRSQSGGFSLVQPYFWAISRSQDATIAVGRDTQRGDRGELEYRYMLSSRSRGQLNSYYLRDKTFVGDPYFNRWALNYQHNLALPFGIDQKALWLDASDRDYSRKIGDIPGRAEPALVSEGGLSRTTREITVSANAKRIRSLLTRELTGFDSNTVQVLPSLTVASVDHRLAEAFPLHMGVSANYSRFDRRGPSFDSISDEGLDLTSSSNFIPGQTPLRKSDRFNIVPEMYYTARLAEVVELVPSVQYRSYHYQFDDRFAPSTNRGYLLGQAEAATTVDRVYGDRIKHSFRPSLIYSNIPFVQEDQRHPFIQQLKTGGYQFDQYDIVPVTSEDQRYFVPLGNSLSYRLGNKLILKSEGTPAEYRKVVGLTSGQSVNFKEFQKDAEDQRPLSRFFTFLTVDTLRVQGRGEFFYYPYEQAKTYKLAASYVFARYRRRLLQFERSMTLSYNADQVAANSKEIGGSITWSINDYFGVGSGISYQFPFSQNSTDVPGRVKDVRASLTYQSPSQCYKIVVDGAWRIDNPEVAVNLTVPINLTGEGFANLQDGGGLVNPSGAR
ncbi:MAG: hypothetical protein AB1540_10345 [Bdellovibrionota bacterium]